MTVSMAIFSMLVSPVMANVVNDQIFEERIFEIQPDRSMDVEELSHKEMKETEGAAALPPSRGGWGGGGGGGRFGGAIGGAVVGGYAGGYGYLASGGKDPNKFKAAVIGGAAGGFFSPVTSYKEIGRSLASSVTSAVVSAHVAPSDPSASRPTLPTHRPTSPTHRPNLPPSRPNPPSRH